MSRKIVVWPGHGSIQFRLPVTAVDSICTPDIERFTVGAPKT